VTRTPARPSVIIPAFNATRYLREAIDSVLAQSRPPFEVIVVDDGSTDATESVVRRFPAVRYIAQIHGGIAAARNRGVRAATGNCLTFLDADDRWTPGKLETQLAALEADPEFDMLLGHCVEARQSEWVARFAPSLPADGGIPGYLAGTSLIRRAAFERVGPFEPSLRAGEFIDWLLRARARGLRIRMLPGIVLWRRLHDANHGVLERAAYSDYARVLKNELDRRRGRREP
jgi:glycosyltransferase involved in cell wall biosynthesis